VPRGGTVAGSVLTSLLAGGAFRAASNPVRFVKEDPMHASARWLFVVWLTLIGGVALVAHASPQTGGAAQAAAPAAIVNLNTASPAELERLPGIGPRTAERIVEYRTKHGDFKKVEELMNVQGIGEKSFLRLKPLISVTPPKASPSGAWG